MIEQDRHGQSAISRDRLPYASHRITGEINLNSPVWEEIRQYGKVMELEKGSSFFPDSLSVFYCIEKGRLRKDFTTRSGRQRSLLIYEMGSIINLAHSVLGTEAFDSFSVLEDCLIWRMECKTITEVPVCCPHLAGLCLRILSSANLTYNVALTYLDIDDFKIRFCRYLALNMRRYGAPVFSIGLTQEECAHTLGVHRATLAKAVQILKKEGIIKCFTRQKVHILNTERLYQIAGS